VSLRITKQIRVELELLNFLMKEFHDLVEKCRTQDPTTVENVALAALLHSFYNGIENIFKRVSVEVDGSHPRGEFWHSELLKAMTQATASRPAVISEGLRNTLRDYLDFRHRFRHAYPFELKWNRMAPLVLAAENTLKQLEVELEHFLSAIEPESEP